MCLRGLYARALSRGRGRWLDPHAGAAMSCLVQWATHGKGGALAKASADLIAQTCEVWGRRYGRPISEQEAQEIIDNMVGFAKVLIDWYVTDGESADRFLEATKTSSDAPPSRRE